MIVQPGIYDPTDKVALIHAILTLNDADDDILLSPPDIGRLDKVAQYAAEALAGLIDEGDNWDGVLWYERLEAAYEGSLAHALLQLAVKEFNPKQRATNPFDETGATLVWAVVKEWAVLRNLPLSRWSNLL